MTFIAKSDFFGEIRFLKHRHFSLHRAGGMAVLGIKNSSFHLLPPQKATRMPGYQAYGSVRMQLVGSGLSALGCAIWRLGLLRCSDLGGLILLPHLHE